MATTYEDVDNYIKSIDKLLNIAIELAKPFKNWQKTEIPNISQIVLLEDGIIPLVEIKKFDVLYRKVFKKDFKLLLLDYFSGDIDNKRTYEAEELEREYLKVSDKFRYGSHTSYSLIRSDFETLSKNLSENFYNEYYNLYIKIHEICKRVRDDNYVVGDLVYKKYNDGRSLERVIELYSDFIETFEMIQQLSKDGRRSKADLQKLYRESLKELSLIMYKNGKFLIYKAKNEIRSSIAEEKYGFITIYKNRYINRLQPIHEKLKAIHSSFTRESVPAPFDFKSDDWRFYEDVKYNYFKELLDYCEQHLSIDSGHDTILDKKESSGISAPMIRRFCELVNDSGLEKKGDESVSVFCKRICEKYQLNYTDNVRQYFSANDPIKNYDKKLKQVIDIIFPKIDVKAIEVIKLYIDKQLKIV